MNFAIANELIIGFVLGSFLTLILVYVVKNYNFKQKDNHR